MKSRSAGNSALCTRQAKYWSWLLLSIVLCLPVTPARGYWELRIFRPAEIEPQATNEYRFTDSGTWTEDTDLLSFLGTVTCRAQANHSNSAVTAYVKTADGAGVAVGVIDIDFAVPEKCHVYATVCMTNASCAPTAGIAVFAGTDWGWRCNNGRWHWAEVDKTFTAMKVAQQVLSAELLLIDVAAMILCPELELVFFALEMSWDAYELAEFCKTLEEDKTAVERTEHFSFVVPAGTNRLAIGLAGHAISKGCGAAAAFIMTSVGEIRLGLNSQGGMQPDLVISGITLQNEKSLRRDTANHIAVDLLNIGNSRAELGGYQLAAVPAQGPTEWIRPAGSPYFPVDPYLSRQDTLSYAFKQKGKYTLQAVADPENLMTELTETNNTLAKEIYVFGNPPDKPDTPWSSPVRHRNQPFTIATWSDDHDGDPILYSFQIRAEGSTKWCSLTNLVDGDTNSWGTRSNLTLTPVLDETEFIPMTGSAGADTRTWFRVAADQGYCVRTLAADSDGVSVPSDERPLTIIYNEPLTPPTVLGSGIGSTLVPYTITVTNYDVEGDAVGFRFSWGDGVVATWSDWQWCARGQPSLTASHIYERPPGGSPPYSYKIRVQATDRYAYLHGGGTSDVAEHRVIITNYFSVKDILVVTRDADADVVLPRVRFHLDEGASYSADLMTGVDGQLAYTWVQPGETNFTVTFSNVNGYVTPPQQTRCLTVGGTNNSLQFSGLYRHKTGTIRVNCNLNAQGDLAGTGTAAGQHFHFTGPSWTTRAAWLGDYTVTYGRVDPTNYSEPIPSIVTQSLTEGAELEFNGRYLRRPIVNLVRSYPTNSYNPPNRFVLVNEDAVQLDAHLSSSPEFIPLIAYGFYGDDGRSYIESTNRAPDGVFDGKTGYVFSRSGHRQVYVKATDANGVTNWVAEPVEVWVKDRPQASLALAPEPAIAGEAVTFTGSGSASDPSDMLLGCEWTNHAGQLLTTNPAFSANFTAGEYALAFRVQASDWVWSRWARTNLEVVTPRDWPAFKREERRTSFQFPYQDRTYGQLPFRQTIAFAADSAIQGSPVAANLDGNDVNGLEVVLVSTAGTLYVLGSDGTLRWQRPVGPSSSTPAIGDVNGDGLPDIVVGTRSNVWCFDRNGATNFSYGYVFRETNCSFEYSMPVLADIDPRVVGREVAITADDGSVHLIYGDGTRRTNGWPFPPTGAPKDPMFAPSPAVCGLDPRYVGQQVVVGTLDGRLLVFNGDGQIIASNAIASHAEIHTTAAVGDFCPWIPGAEVAVGADDGVMYCWHYQPGLLMPVWQFTNSPAAPIRSSPAAAVLGEARVPQLTFGCDNGLIILLNATNGTLLSSFSCGLTNPIRSTPAIANIDTVSNSSGPMGDLPEVIVGAKNGWLYAINFAMGTARVVWQKPLGNGLPIFSSPAVADINHDPEMEILVGGTDGVLHVLTARADPALMPVANCAMQPTSGVWPLTVSFTDLSSNSPTAWFWSFGDGNTSSQQTPINVYQAPGTYTVRLMVRNAHGSDTQTVSNGVTVYPAPRADFAGTPRFGFVPLTVSFTNWSMYGTNTWSWDFGDGGASTTEHPGHTYTSPGFYTVRLTTSNPYGTGVETKTNYIIVQAKSPAANFTQSVNYGCAPLTVSFTDLSANTPGGWLWRFDDGTTSTQQNPTHTYQTNGHYLVSLTVSNAAGADTRVLPFYLTVLQGTVSNYVPILDLQLNEGSGTVAYDATTNQTLGTIAGPTWVTNAPAGYTLRFHGGGQWFDGDVVTVPHSPTLDITCPFSVEARIQTSSLENYLAIVDKYAFTGPGNQACGFTVYLTGGRLRFSVYSAGNGSGGCWGTNDLRDNTWHRIRVAWNGAVMRTYVDDLLQGECAWAYGPASTTQNLGIGKRLSGWGGYMPFDGLIDYVVVSRLEETVNPRPTLDIARSGSQLQISWECCGVLQSASDLAGPWNDVPDAFVPFVFTPTATQAFFRLKAP